MISDRGAIKAHIETYLRHVFNEFPIKGNFEAYTPIVEESLKSTFDEFLDHAIKAVKEQPNSVKPQKWLCRNNMDPYAIELIKNVAISDVSIQARNVPNHKAYPCRPHFVEEILPVSKPIEWCQTYELTVEKSLRT